MGFNRNNLYFGQEPIFKYVNSIRNTKGKLRSWKEHDKIEKQQQKIDRGSEYWAKVDDGKIRR